jgi:hypothetical protein
MEKGGCMINPKAADLFRQYQQETDPMSAELLYQAYIRALNEPRVDDAVAAAIVPPDDERALEIHEYRVKRCRAQECRGRIIWLNCKGRVHPTDADSVEVGDADFDPDKGHISHFATCVAAGRFRKAR